jgi:transposase-like protein
MESMRWPNGPICPHCGSVEKHYFLTPKSGTTRKTRTGSETQRRVWKCKTCRKQFSVTTGTVFHGSRVPLQTWLMVVFEMCANKNGIAAREIERKYGVAPKTAWFMTQRLREAMQTRAPEKLLSGTVVADETWIGGEPKNRHGHKPGKGGQGQTDGG